MSRASTMVFRPFQVIQFIMTSDPDLEKIRRKKSKTHVLNDLIHFFMNLNQQNMHYPCNKKKKKNIIFFCQCLGFGSLNPSLFRLRTQFEKKKIKNLNGLRSYISKAPKYNLSLFFLKVVNCDQAHKIMICPMQVICAI